MDTPPPTVSRRWLAALGGLAGALPVLVVGTFVLTAEPGEEAPGVENDAFRMTFDWLWPMLAVWALAVALLLAWRFRRWAGPR